MDEARAEIAAGKPGDEPGLNHAPPFSPPPRGLRGRAGGGGPAVTPCGTRGNETADEASDA
jgi:hypothetical protein